MTALQRAKCETFRALHESPSVFVMPNPWDVGSALYLQSRGFKALASTSAGAAYVLGRPDGGMTVDEVLTHLRALAEATSVPVNADFEDGLAADIAMMARHVSRCVETGIAGLSIEDRNGDALYPFDVALDRVRAARRAIDATGMPVVLTARSEAALLGLPNALEEATKRLRAFGDAGADCLYAPGAWDGAAIAVLVQAVAPIPLNVLVSTPGPSVTQLGALGVRRISVGSALARAAWGALMASTEEIVRSGTFGGFAANAPFKTLNALFAQAGNRGARAGNDSATSR